MTVDLFISLNNIYTEVNGENSEEKKEDFNKVMEILYNNKKFKNRDVKDFLMLETVLESPFFRILFLSKIENMKVIQLTFEYYLVKNGELQAYRIINLLLDIYTHLCKMNDMYYNDNELSTIREEMVKQQSKSDDKEVSTPALMKIIKDKREKNKFKKDTYVDDIIADVDSFFDV